MSSMADRKKWLYLISSLIVVVVFVGLVLANLRGFRSKNSTERNFQRARVIFKIKKNEFFNKIGDLLGLESDKIKTGSSTKPDNLESYVFELSQSDIDVVSSDPSPKKIQIRGVVEMYKGNLLSIKVGENIEEIILPNKVFVTCLQETMPIIGGGEVDMKKAFVGFSRETAKSGVEIDREELNEIINIGDEVTIQAFVGDNGKKEADMIVGYGCKLLDIN